MLESLSILLERQGRSQVVPLAAGRGQGELGAASVRYHNLDAEYLGILTFWKRNRKTQADIPAQRPVSQNTTLYPKLLRILPFCARFHL